MSEKLKLEILNGEKMEFSLIESFNKKIFFEEKEYLITIPKNTKTDFASIPKIFWNILTPLGKYEEAALLHDVLYRTGGLLIGLPFILTRKKSDKLFKEIMIMDNVNKRKAYLMWGAVRLFGKRFWQKQH